MLRTFWSSTIFLMASATLAQDPVETDGDKYKVLFESERLRVLAYRDLPGEKTQPHHHPAFVLYAPEPFKRRLSLPDGTEILREFKAGEVLFSDEQTPVGENIGDTATQIIMVELKNGRGP